MSTSVHDYVFYNFDDEAFLQHLVREGNSLDVAQYVVSSQKEAMMVQFAEKSSVLSHEFQQLSVYDFLDFVFPGCEKYMTITSGDGSKKDADEKERKETSSENDNDEEEGKGTYSEMGADDLVDYQSTRNDVFVSPCSFINGYYSNATCRNIYALIIDVDEVKPSVLRKVIENKTLGRKIPMPSVIVNSGAGLHFYYVFEKPIPYFKKNRKSLNDIYKKLFVLVKNNIAAKADWHSMIQPFRLPGSLTKLDQMAVAFTANAKWDIHKLAKKIGMEFEGDLIQLEVVDQREYKKRQLKKKTGEKCPRCGEDLVIRINDNGDEFVGCLGYPECTFMMTMGGELIEKKKKRKRKRVNQGFYEYCLENVKENTSQGRRYLAMVGLVIVAYKTGIGEERVKKDLEELVDHYNEIGALFKSSEVNKAMRAYNHKAIKTRSTTLEEYFGWKFKRIAKIHKGEKKIDIKAEQEESDKNKEYREFLKRKKLMVEDEEKKQTDKIDKEKFEKFKESTKIDFIEEQKEVISNKEYRKTLEEEGVLDEFGDIKKVNFATRRARQQRDIKQSERGRRWDDNKGKKTKENVVKKWRKENPKGTKAACIRETGLSKPTVYKWWNS